MKTGMKTVSATRFRHPAGQNMNNQQTISPITAIQL